MEIEITPAEERQIRARYCDSRARELEESNVKAWAELAALCIEVEDRVLWQELGFKHFEAWLMDAAPHSRSTALAGKRALRELAPHIPAEDIAQMPHGNAHVLRQVSDSVKRDPEIIQAAKTKTKKQLRSTIQEKYPDQHLEHEFEVRFFFTESQKAILDHAVAAVREMDPDVKTLEGAVEYILQEWIADVVATADAEKEARDEQKRRTGPKRNAIN